jgi:hypothetical protein
LAGTLFVHACYVFFCLFVCFSSAPTLGARLERALTAVASDSGAATLQWLPAGALLFLSLRTAIAEWEATVSLGGGGCCVAGSLFALFFFFFFFFFFVVQ